MSAIRVVIVDDHPMVRAGLRALLEESTEVAVVGEASDGTQIEDLVAWTEAEVVLMDLSMPRVDGVTATKRIAVAAPGVSVVALTSLTDRARVRAAMSAGAVGYVLKDSEPEDLLQAIAAAAAGNVPIDPRVAGALLPIEEREATPSAAVLSAREQEVLTLVARGLANKQIASRLGISEATVKAHLGSVFRQIGVADRTSAALWARDHGLG